MATLGQSAKEGMGEPDGVASPSAALSLAELFRQKRREAGLSQQELADRCGVKQSAISGFERYGNEAQALSAEKIQQVADVLGIVVHEGQVKARPHAARLALLYCPNADCPSALAYRLGTETAYQPRFIRAEADIRLFCPDCGEICECRCPGCRTPISERLRGAFCPECGSPYIRGDRLGEQDVVAREACRLALAAAALTTDFRHARERDASSG